SGRPLGLAGLLLGSWFGGVIGGFVATVIMVATLVRFFYQDANSTTSENLANLIAFVFLALLINGFNYWRRQVEQDLMVAHRELHSRVQLEQDLRARAEESEAYFRSVFSSANDAILIADSESVFIDANPAAE